MDATVSGRQRLPALTLATLPTPAKALATCIIVALGLGMVGALGQIIVHDIIPTFYNEMEDAAPAVHAGGHGDTAPAAVPAAGDRGDLFADLSVAEKRAPRLSISRNSSSGP